MRQRIKEIGGKFALRNGNPGAIVEIIVPVTASASTLDSSVTVKQTA